MAARFHCAGAPEVRRRETAWLGAAVLINVLVALTLHGGVRDRLWNMAFPEPRLAPEPVAGPWTCVAWGPFAEAAVLDPLIARVKAMGGETELIASRLGAGPDYLLLVGPQGSFEAARRIREELRSQSIDSHIVPRGTFARSLEVGIFADRAQALARQARIEDLGYLVHLRELQRAAPAFYLVARMARVSAHELPPAGDCGVVAPGHRFL